MFRKNVSMFLNVFMGTDSEVESLPSGVGNRPKRWAGFVAIRTFLPEEHNLLRNLELYRGDHNHFPAL